MGLLLFFCAAGLLLFSPLFYDMYQLPKALMALPAVFFAMAFMVFGREKSDVTLPSIFTMLLCLYTGIWALLSPNHPPLYYAALAFSPALFFVSFHSKIKADTFAFFISLLLLASLAFGLYQFFFLNINRPYSFFGNPIFFAEFIGFTLPIALYSAINGGRASIPAFICLPLSIPAMVTASSRGPAASAAVSLFILIFYFVRAGAANRLKLPALAIIAALITLPFLTPGFTQSLNSAFTRAAGLFSIENPAIQNRLNLAQSSLKIFKDSPVFGSGPGAVKKYQQLKQASILKDYPDYQFVNSSYTHNDYIQLLAETGLTGLLLYLALLFSLAHAFEKSSPKMEQKTFLFCTALFSSVIFIISESFFNFPLFSYPSSALLFIAAGLIARECLPYGAPLKPAVPFIFARISAALLAIILLGYLSFIKPGAIASNIYLKEALKTDFAGKTGADALYKKAESLEKDSFFAIFHHAQYLALRKKYGEAVESYTKLLALFPYSADVMYNIGSIHLIRGMHNEALLKFDEALFYHPDFALAHMGAYKALKALGQNEQADKHLEAAALSDRSILNPASRGKVILFKEVTGNEEY